MMQPIRIMLVDDHKVIRDGIRSYLDNIERYLVVAEASDGKEALARCEETKIDIVMMDINMDKMDGIECTEILAERYPYIKVIAMTMLSESLHIKKMLSAGAKGYILKSSDEDEIKNAIEAVEKGGTYYSAEVTGVVMQSISGTTTRKPKGANKYIMETPITEREKEVLELICKQYSNKEIAEELFIGLRTVDAHKRNLLEKTGAKNVAGLVIYAMERNLFSEF